MQRLVTIIRGDLSPGYQIAQTVHAVAEFTMMNPKAISEWYSKSNYVLSLSVKNEEELVDFAKQLYTFKDLFGYELKFNLFYEPDVNQMTSIAFLSTPETDSLTKGMPLAGKSSGDITVRKVQR